MARAAAEGNTGKQVSLAEFLKPEVLSKIEGDETLQNIVPVQLNFDPRGGWQGLPFVSAYYYSVDQRLPKFERTPSYLTLGWLTNLRNLDPAEIEGLSLRFSAHQWSLLTSKGATKPPLPSAPVNSPIADGSRD